MTYYILGKNKRVKKAKDVIEWGTFFEDRSKRVVKQTMLKNNLLVSTVFLGLDHRFTLIGRPLLFETMVFDQENKSMNPFTKKPFPIGNEVDCKRCSTWGEAEAQHEASVKEFQTYERQKPENS